MTLPKGWTKRPLGGKNGITKIVSGSTPSSDEPSFWNGDIHWATPTDIGRLTDIYISDTERKITQKGFEDCSTAMIPPYCVMMTSRAPVGNLAINTIPICTNQGFKCFIPNDDIDAHYLFFYLKHIVVQIQKESHGNTFTEITKEQIQKVDIILPPTKSEQQQIATDMRKRLIQLEQIRQHSLNQLSAIDALPAALLRKVFSFDKY